MRRFELTELGIDQLIRQTRHGKRGLSTRGEVVGKSRSDHLIQVKFDNRKTPVTLSRKFVRIIEDDPAPSTLSGDERNG